MTDPLRSPKLRAWHLDRSAFVYVRQSTPQQVIDHQESTARQYALADRAVALGWAADRITTIDDDLGKSGQSIEGRPGFQRLLAEVALDHVGLILGLEMSRLARSNRDWHQLLELCAASACSWPTPTAIYDPADHNDRLLLGLHGMMSEAELHVLKERMYQGKLNKARRGALMGMPPIGYVRLASGEWAIDPDEQVQATVRLIFDQFDREATLHGLLRYLVHHGVRIPVRSNSRPEPGRAGVAAAEPGDAVEPAAPPELRRGLSVRPPAVDPRRKRPGRPTTGKLIRRPEECLVLIRDRLPAYITWDRFRGEPGATRGQPGPAGPARGTAAGGLAAGRAAAVRAVRPADDRAVLGGRRIVTPTTVRAAPPTTPSRSARASRGRCSTTWSPAGSWRPSSRRRWRRAWRRWPRSSGSGPSWPGTGNCVASGPATRPIGRPGSTRRASRRTAWSAASWSVAGRRR